MPGQNIHIHVLPTFELIRGYDTKGGSPICLMQMDIHKAYDVVGWRA